MTKKKPDVAFNSKSYFANYYGKGLSYFDRPFDRSFEAEDFQQARDIVAPKVKFKTFLDLGAADGRAMDYASKMHTFERLDGIELSAEAVGRALPGANIVHGDVVDVLNAMDKHPTLLPKYDVILASLLMYFDEKALAKLLLAIPKVCHKDTLILFPLDPDTGSHHGYVKGVYKKEEPEAFVSLYRPLTWWHATLSRAGFEIVYYRDPVCPVYRYNPYPQPWSKGNLLGDSTQVSVTYLDDKVLPATLLSGPKVMRSVMQLQSGTVKMTVGLCSERVDGDDAYYWLVLNKTKRYNYKEKQALADFRAYVKQIPFGGGILRLQPVTDFYQVIPGFYPLYDPKKKTYTQETDVAL